LNIKWRATNVNLEITKLPNGNLSLCIPDAEDRKEVLEELARDDRSEIDVWYDLLEPYFTNGSYQPIDPGCLFVGLTDDPYILAETGCPTDDLDMEVEGGLWHYDRYMLDNVVEMLGNGETVILEKFDDTEGKVVTLKNMYNKYKGA
jgi:hypothetical protein